MPQPSKCRKKPAWNVLPASTDPVSWLWQALAAIGIVLVVTTVLRDARMKQRESAESKPVHRVDINFASDAELDLLPGIGPALAREIILSRPYSTAEELERVKGISKKMATRLLPLVKAGQGRRAADQ